MRASTSAASTRVARRPKRYGVSFPRAISAQTVRSESEVRCDTSGMGMGFVGLEDLLGVLELNAGTERGDM